MTIDREFNFEKDTKMKATRYILSVLLLLLSTAFTFAQQSIPKDTFITLERTPCFGTCPFYKLTILADGKVEFEPKRMTKKYKLVSGKLITSQITQDKLKQLITEFESIGYFSLENIYGRSDFKEDKNCPEMWTDYSTAFTSILINGKSKQINHYHGCQGSAILEKLTKLEDKIDEIVNTKQWLQLSEDAMDEVEVPSEALQFDRYWNLTPKKEKAHIKEITPVIKQQEENYGRSVKIFLVYYYSQENDKHLGLTQATQAKKYLEANGIKSEKIKIIDGGKEDKSEIVIYLD